MRISYRETSLVPYREVNLIPRTITVYNVICVLQSNKKRGCTDAEIKNYLNKNTNQTWESGQVSARRGALVDHGLVIATGKVINKITKQPNTTWKTTSLDWEHGINALRELTA